MPVFLKNVTKTRVLRVLKMCHLAATSSPRHRHEGGQCHVEFFPPAPCWCGEWRGPAKMWRGGAKIRRGPAKYWRGMSSQHNFTTLSSDAYVYFDITFDVLGFFVTSHLTCSCFTKHLLQRYCVLYDVRAKNNVFVLTFWLPLSLWFWTSFETLQHLIGRYTCLLLCSL